MFIKIGDDPKTKVITVVDTSGAEELDATTKLALEKVKENVVKGVEQEQVVKEKN